MCWSAPVSFITLALGTLGNVSAYIFVRRTDPRGAMILAYWQFGLQMQLLEGLAWTSLDRGSDSVLAARSAMLFNVLQPVALAIVVWATGSQARLALLAMLFYIVVMAVEFEEVWALSASIAPVPGCAHLDLQWWDGGRSALYVTASVVCFLDLVDAFWRYLHLTFFLATFTLSVALYSCGGGSMWCWMIASSGPVVAVAHATRRAYLVGRPDS